MPTTNLNPGDRFNVVEKLAPGGTMLLNSPFGPDQIWDHLPEATQHDLLRKEARLYVIDASRVARECGMAGRINTVMQVCFFSVSGVLPHDEAIGAIKNSIRKTYGKKGEEIVAMNLAAVDNALAQLHELKIPGRVSSQIEMRKPVPNKAPAFVRNVLASIIVSRGDDLPVSALPSRRLPPEMLWIPAWFR